MADDFDFERFQRACEKWVPLLRVLADDELTAVAIGLAYTMLVPVCITRTNLKRSLTRAFRRKRFGASVSMPGTSPTSTSISVSWSFATGKSGGPRTRKSMRSFLVVQVGRTACSRRPTGDFLKEF